MRALRSRRALSVIAIAMVAAALTPAVALADETTIAYGPMRSSWDDAEPGLTLGAVTEPDFGQLWSVTLPRPQGTDVSTYPNQMYAQPLVVGGKVIVATEENQVDALDAKTGALDWNTTLGTPLPAPVSCGNIAPHIGITGTPVYDPVTRAVYLVTKAADGPGGSAQLRMHALRVTDGSELPGWPVTLAGASTNSGLSFDPATANQRTGLLLLGGSVYFATASHCDQEPYVGFVGGVTTGSSPHLTLWSSEAKAGTNEAGIWQSGGGLVSDGPGRIFLATGNGVSPPPGPGTSPPGTLAESVVRLAVGADGTMTAKDYFSPANNAKLDQDDADLGSGAPLPLPNDYGSSSHPHLLTITGKDGIVRLLDRDALGGTAQGPGGTDAVVSSLNLKGVWGRPAVFDTGTDHYLYLLPSSSPLEALRVAPNAAGVPTLSAVAASADSYGYTSGSPDVTSDGTDAAGALVWIVTVDGSNGDDAMLRAFPAVPPVSGNWRPLVSYPLGTAAKFVQPATDNGRLYVGTRDGRVLAFGRPTSDTITAPPTDFGLVAVGDTANATVTITANAATTVDGVSTSAPFTVGTPTPALPVTLGAGGTVQVPVHFTPTTADTSSGLLTVHTHDATNAPLDYVFALSGTGTQDGLAAGPATLDFGAVVTGTARQLGVTIRNTGTTDATVTGISPPGGPFSAAELPAPGFVIPAQGSVTVTVQFTPTSAGPATGSLGVTADTGSVTVPLQGVGQVGAPHLSLSTSLAFGSVAPGATRTLQMVVSNTGTATMTINKAPLPAPPFTVSAPVAEGQQLAPGDTLTVPVTVRPWTAMPARDKYSITADDGQGPVSVPLSVNVDHWTGTLSSSRGCVDLWQDNRAVGSEIDLWPCSGSSAQRYTFGASSSVRLGPATSTWCLATAGGHLSVGTAVQLATCNGSAAQQFRWDAANRLTNPKSRLCVEPRDGSANRGTPLVLATCTAARAERWDASRLFAPRGLMSSFVGAPNQRCLTGASGALVLDPCAFGAGQIVTHHGSQLLISNRCIAAGATRHVSTSTVRLATCTTAASQVFRSLSGQRLQNPATGLCLTVYFGHTAPGTKVWLTGCGSTARHRWRLPG